MTEVLPLRPFVCLLLGLQAGLLAWQAYGDSATWDEVGHFSAGIDHWRHGRFDMYCVNPPLVRMVALAPVVILDSNLDPEECCPQRGPGRRPEFSSGTALAAAAGIRYFSLLTFARWMSIPFALLGGWICYRWASELWGQTSGLLSLTLWVVSPTVLAYGHLITPDMGAAGMGVAAMYALRRWLMAPALGRALLAGSLLGLAELTKLTWLVLLIVWPVCWLVYRLLQRRLADRRQWLREAIQVVAMLVAAFWVINLAYGFEGSFQPLRSFDFISEALGGTTRREAFNDVRVGNRFAGSWIGELPVPVPANYILGIDLIKFEEEKRYWSYLRGEWRLGGWWYYYLYAMSIKEPVGTWVLAALAIYAGIAMRSSYACPLREELLLLFPMCAVLGLVSSQTGFNHHVRYVLPAFPFLFILVGRLGRSIDLRNRGLAVAVCSALAWTIVSSLRVVPHSLSYYNELVGGPTGGHYCLGESNTDWGQDLLYLRSWLRKHPTAKPLHLAYDLPLIDLRSIGMNALDVPVGPHSTAAAVQLPDQLGPLPGFYAISVNKMHNRELDFDYFLRLRPVGMAGYSIYIYDVTVSEANRVRQEFGIPLLIGQGRNAEPPEQAGAW